MDPRTGYPAQGMLSVSVIAPRTLDSEAWTKPYFINGRPWAAKAQAKGFSRVLLRRQDGKAMRVAPMTSRFLDACRRRPTDVRPVWFMRQAGRYMKQYRDIREKHGILEICKRPDLAATVTLQPDRDAGRGCGDHLCRPAAARRADGAEAAVRRRRRARSSTTPSAPRTTSIRSPSPIPTTSATWARRSSTWSGRWPGESR